MLRSLILLLPLLSRAGATLNFSRLETTPLPLPALVLSPQAPAFDFDLYSALPPANSTSKTLQGLPSGRASGPGAECSASMSATAVTFEDCGDAINVCRCVDATMSAETVVDRLGRVPVGLRRYIGTVVVLRAAEPSAYTLTNGDIHLFGDCAMDTWVHEASHAFDFATATPVSSGAGWTQAIADDTCAPDNYSLTNRVEDFAQMSVMKTYALLYDGYLPPGFRADCMAHQLEFLSTLPLFNASALFGNTCALSDSLPARHTTPPLTPDPSRVFSTVSVNFATASVAPFREHQVLPNGARRLRQSLLVLLGLISSIATMGV